MAKEKKLEEKYPTLKLKDEKEIAFDFAVKVYERFNKLIKSIILFGSAAKGTLEKGSDIDIIIIVDDASIKWDDELVAWYREELGRLIELNPYIRPLHVNTVKLVTWWEELLRGEPVVLNVIRYGEPLIDFGGFFLPLKFLMADGKIRSTPEAIYNALQRAPRHLARSRASIFNAIEAMYWAMVDSAHAALIAANQIPPSPEYIPAMLKSIFTDKKILDLKYVLWYRDLYVLAHKILHGEIKEISGKELEEWHKRTDEFVGEMARIINLIIST
ncbi:MAG: nucleotidyltransferase domain-containing protein [Candidatus Pacearchaeota archaeon]